VEKAFHLLQVGNTAADAAAVVHLLKKAGYHPEAKPITTANQLSAALLQGPCQLLIVHHPASGTSQVSTIEILRQYSPDLAIIVIVDKIEKAAIDFMKAGACDCIAKDDLPTLLSAAVENAIHQTSAQQTHAQTMLALRESEEKFSRAFFISPDSININRLEDGVYIDVNEGFTRILGYTSEEVIGRSSKPGDLGIWVNQVDRDRMIAELKDKREVTGFEAPFRAKDGHVVTGLMSARILKIRGVECVLTITRDITARRQAEEAIKESEERLRTILDTSEAGYFFIDTAGRFQRVNPAWLRLHGYDRAEEVIGKHFSLTQTDADLQNAVEVVEKLKTGVRTSAGEFTRKRKDGSIGYHSFSTHLVKEGGSIVGFEGFIIDTTSLRAAREQYSMLFDQLLDGFALHEMVLNSAGEPIDYRFIALNPAFEEMTGLKASAVIGRCVREILPGVEPKWIKLYGEVVRTGEPRSFEDFSRELNKHFEIVAFRPKPGQFACLVRDATARKQLEVQLRHSQKMDAVGQLAGGVAHDFNNFLAAIMMHLSLLHDTSGLSAEVKGSLKELESEAKRAASLTRQLLMFSRKQEMQICATDLNDQITNILKMLRRLIGEHIKLVFTSESKPLWINADPGMIDQVIMNLCVNARDAMPQGGRLTIEASAMNLSSTDVLGDAESRSGNFACMTVSDTGCGMDAATLNRIFEPFFTSKEPDKGTGLGLATVYSIVKQHLGWINVKSTVGQGSVFRVFLPTCAAPQSSGSAPTQATIMGGAEGVLVVEDDYGFRNMVAMSLKVLGYRVFVADDGRAALQLWEKHAQEIGLLFTDLVMPDGLDGLELCRRLKQNRPSLRMIITTGYPSNRIKLAQLASEDITFLPKPFSSEELATAVRRCIDKQ